MAGNSPSKPLKRTLAEVPSITIDCRLENFVDEAPLILSLEIHSKFSKQDFLNIYNYAHDHEILFSNPFT